MIIFQKKNSRLIDDGERIAEGFLCTGPSPRARCSGIIIKKLMHFLLSLLFYHSLTHNITIITKIGSSIVVEANAFAANTTAVIEVIFVQVLNGKKKKKKKKKKKGLRGNR